MQNSQNPDFALTRFAELGDSVLPILDAHRESGPLLWSEANHCWIATGHDVVVEGFSGRLPLSAKRHEIIAAFFPDPIEREEKAGYLLHTFSRFLINIDPPEQSRLRKLVMGAFTRRVAESFRPYARTLVDEVLAGVDWEIEFDFVARVARPVTARAILRIIGLSEEHLASMEYWAHTLNAGLGGTADAEMLEKTNRVLEEIRDVFEAEIVRRGAENRDDFISLLTAAREGDDRLTRDEVIAQLILVLIAGHDTTLNTMALVMAKLADLPEQRQFMQANFAAFETCIMEMMRAVAMSTAMARIVAADFEWRGQHLRKGEIVFLMIAAANRDPAVFKDPERVDFGRSQQGNMTFAPGQHFCIGHWFAKMMMMELFRAVFDRFGNWDVLDESPQFTSAVSFRGLVGLRLRMHRRGARVAVSSTVNEGA